MDSKSYVPTKLDIDKIYSKLFKHYYKRLKTEDDETQKKIIIEILEDIINNFEVSINILNNNIGNYYEVNDRNEYVYVIMSQHGYFPRYNQYDEDYELIDLTTNKPIDFKEVMNSYISKLPENALMIDLVESGGSLTCNRLYEQVMLDGDYYELLNGNVKDFNKKPSNELNKTLKFLDKNVKIYREGDYFINMNSLFENYSEHWYFAIKEDDNSEFIKINKKYKNKNKVIERKVIEFFNKTQNRKKTDYFSTDNIIKQFVDIFPNKKIVFIPLSCRHFPKYIFKHYTDVGYNLFIRYIALVDNLLKISRDVFVSKRENEIEELKSLSSIYGLHGYYVRRLTDKERDYFRVKEDVVKALKMHYDFILDGTIVDHEQSYYTPLPDEEREERLKSISQKQKFRGKYLNILNDNREKLDTKNILKLYKEMWVDETTPKLRLKSDIKKGTTLKIRTKKVIKNKKKCKDHQIINPKTQRCVKKTGRIGRKLTLKKCRDDQIINPKTNRCVKKTGRIGRNLI